MSSLPLSSGVASFVSVTVVSVAAVPPMSQCWSAREWLPGSTHTHTHTHTHTDAHMHQASLNMLFNNRNSNQCMHCPILSFVSSSLLPPTCSSSSRRGAGGEVCSGVGECFCGECICTKNVGGVSHLLSW